MLYCDVILPVPVEGTFTYLLPEALADCVGEGFRVVVPFGKSKLYSGIVVRKHSEPPTGNFELKAVVDVLDEQAMVLPRQLRLWQWMAEYYMCPLGDVYKAAVPSGLRLESESTLAVNEDFDQWAQLKPQELQVFELLQSGKVHTVAQLSRSLKDARVLSRIKSLMGKGAVTVKETLDAGYRPRCEVHVRLASAYQTEEAFMKLCDELERTPKRLQLVTTYADMAGWASAFKLHNPQLVKEVSKAELLKRSGVSAAVLTAMRSKGILETYDFEVGRLGRVTAELVEQLPLSPAQQTSLDEIHRAFEKQRVCLLHGVTSSGKTEIYIRLIREVIEQGGQVLYLVPEIALTTQLTQRLRRIFGDRMGVYHSKFPDSERVEIWQKQLSAEPYSLLLGARSGLFLPQQRLQLIIVDEEHETSYKQEEPAPRYHARDTAVMMAGFHACHVLLGTATPSFESFSNATGGKYGYASLTTRYGEICLPHIEVADVRELMRTKQMRPPFSPRLEEEIRKALARQQQVILFQNRRGYVPVVECASCGWTPTCECCDVTLTYHQDIRKMVCHYCGRTFKMPRACPNCGCETLRSIGFGTEKIEEEVQKRFPTARTARLDLDTTRSRTAYERIIGEFAAQRTDVLIGTQMVSKGLDFDHVHVVGILDADTMLTRPDFRSFERTFQMLSQVAGRAGRRQSRGYVILQTRHADYPVIQRVVDNDFLTLFQEQMEEREAFHYPPYYRLYYVYLKHRELSVVEQAANYLEKVLRASFGPRILGPDKPAVSRVQFWHIRKLALKAERSLSMAQTRAILRAAVHDLQQQPRFNSLRIYFDVDPV